MNISNRTNASVACAALFMACATHAQTGGTFVFTSSNVVSPASPSTTIEIWATWDDPRAEWGFGGANYDIVADGGLFSGPVNILMGPGSSAGLANGNTVTGGANGQLNLPGFPLSGLNPMLLASYTWTATDFTPRMVGFVTTNTNNFIIADLITGAARQLYSNEFTPGAGVINVVPAPGGLVLIAGALAIARRRRA